MMIFVKAVAFKSVSNSVIYHSTLSIILTNPLILLPLTPNTLQTYIHYL